MNSECDFDHSTNDDPEIVVKLYQDHWKSLYASAYKILKDKQASEDIVQDVFVQMWNKRHELQINTSIQAYLFASVRYEVFRKIRELKKFEPIADEMIIRYSESSPAERLEYKEYLQQISQEVYKLPEKCREVYVLSREQHLSNKEISNKLSISPKTVRNHLTRALRQLRLGIVDVLLILITLFIR